MADQKTYTLAEIAEHNSIKSCWIAIDDKVYDVTEYINGHHGGNAILNGCGRDATFLFKNRPNTKKIPHPQEALDDLKSLYIGELEKNS